MATTVDICNLALSHLGDKATLASIDPPEGSAQADHCARFWPIARDEALSSFDWSFASRIEGLTPLLDADDGQGWAYAYAEPADLLVAREIVQPDFALVTLYPEDPQFDRGTASDGRQVLLTAYEAVSIRYTRRVSNPTRFSPPFVTALSYLLASYLAGPVVKGRSGVGMASAMREMWERKVSAAKTVDANQRRNGTAFKPAGLKARGALMQSQTVENGAYRYERY